MEFFPKSINSNILLERSTPILLSVGILFSIIIIFSIPEIIPVQNQLLTLPVRIIITKIGIDAHVESVGLTSDGAIDAPKKPINAAWFTGSSLPGEKGTAIIDGHFGWKNGLQAVFDNLHELKIHDEIYVENNKGVISKFIVKKIKVYGEDESTEEFFHPGDDASHLILITCGGVYDGLSKNYSERLVVFSDKE